MKDLNLFTADFPSNPHYSQNKTIMKKYTIKEFAEGKKAVKIENEEQWDKLNNVFPLTFEFKGSFIYGNDKQFSSYGLNNPLNWYIKNNWEVLEFSQLDFEDGFVVGKWYRLTEKNNTVKYIKYLKTEPTGYFWCSEYISNMYENYGGTFGINDAKDLAEVSLEEIQQYLPKGHVDLIKKDTFVLPEFWYIRITRENQESLERWRFPDRKCNLNDYIGGIVGISPMYPNNRSHNPNPNDFWGEGSVEISFEEFKTYVLKEKTMEKEIIGYKFKEQYLKYKDQAAEIGLYNSGYNVQQYYLTEKNKATSNGIKLLKEAGVLDLWFEKVYAPKYSLPKINGKQCVDNGNKTITCGCTTKSFDWILGVEYAMGDDIYISDTKITQKEIKQIVEYINNK